MTVPTISVANIARLVGLNVEALKKLRTRKIVTAPLRKTEWPATVVTEYCDYLRSRISGDSEEDAHAQRTRLLKQQADKLEMENESSRGRLVTLGEMQGVWEKMISAAKSRLLYAPVKLAPVVAVEDSAAICKDLIAEQINEALDELSRKLGEWSADSGPPDVGGEGVEATAETDDQPVVGPDEETVPGS